MKIALDLIPHIEKALGITLYEHQTMYLVHDFGISGGRRNGKTVAYCIKLALSDGEPLNMKKPHEFSDYGGDNPHYHRDFFRREFMRIREFLKDYGFSVREVKF